MPAPSGTWKRRRSLIAQWSVLTVLALVAGSTLGAAYAMQRADGEALATTEEELRRGDIWPPTAPVLTAPEDGALVPTLTPRFTWLPSEDNLPGVTYVIEFSTDAAFQSGMYRRVGAYDGEWQTPENEPFPPGVTMHWRVFAVDAGNNRGPLSETWAFTPVGAALPLSAP